jgi:YegS/Rv2252/BmrU family lipid kinase
MEPLLLIANPYAGGGRIADLLPVVTRVLRARGVAHELRPASGFEEFAALAERAAGEGFAAAVAVGGDGTVNGVVNGVMRAGARIPIGIIPAGTANEFVRSLPIPRGVQKATQALAAGVPTAIDVAQVDGRYFANVLGFGLDARVAAGASRLRDRLSMRGRAVYYLASMIELVSSREPIHVDVVTESDTFSGSVLAVVAVNGRMYGERVPSLPAPGLRDGLIDLYIVRDARRMRSINVTWKVIRRTPIPEVLMQRCRQATIEADRSVDTHVDGNPMGRARRMDVRVVPRGIRVLLPPDTLPWKPLPHPAETAAC